MQRDTLQALSKYKQSFSKHKFQLSANKYKKINLIQKKLNTHELKENILYKRNFANLIYYAFFKMFHFKVWCMVITFKFLSGFP